MKSEFNEIELIASAVKIEELFLAGGIVMTKVVLITGAGRGLGNSLAKMFLKQGYTVFAGVRKLNEGIDKESFENNESLHILEMDVSNTQLLKEAATSIANITSSLDIIINNAGILCKDSFSGEDNTILDDLDADAMLDVYNVNALGALRVTNAFMPLLLNGKTKLLINISSEAGSIAECTRDKWFGYCMSKAAMNMFGVLAHNEIVKYGGRVWQIHPGWMQTYMHGYFNEAAKYSADFSAEQINKLILNMNEYKTDTALFMDMFGKIIDW